MKNTLIYCLLAIITLSACGDKPKNDTIKNTIDTHTTNDDSKEENEIIYTRKGSCDDFVASIDFSSFCFTSVKTPKYRLVQNSESNCQIEFYDNSGYQTVTLSIAFADFDKPMKKDAEPNPEMAKMLFKTFFKKNIQRRMLKTEKDIPNLGDEAYMGFSENKDEQVLGVRTGNVSFRFIFPHGKVKARQSCMSSEEDLKRIGQLIVDSL